MMSVLNLDTVDVFILQVKGILSWNACPIY